MVELPLDDAATAYAKVAEKLANARWGMSISGLEGASADALEETIQGYNSFIDKSTEMITDQSGTVQNQHAADEDLRDNSLPLPEIEKLGKAAEGFERLAESSVGTPNGAMFAARAKAARAKYEDEQQRRESALGRHTTSASTNAPKLLKTPPPLITGGDQLAGLFGGGGYARSIEQMGTQGAGAPGSGGGSSSGVGSPGGSSGGGLPSSAGGGSVDASEVGTSTSSDGASGLLNPAAAGMMGTPTQAQAQQPQMPSMGGTGAGGNGMLGAVPGGTAGSAGSRNRKKDDKKDANTELTGALAATFGAGAAGAVGGAGAAGIDRGASVSGVNTKADTSGVGTNLTSANGKPPVGGNPTGNMMGRGGGGMVGGMGGLGSGVSGTTAKERPDIKPLVKDRDLNGLESLERGVNGGIIGRDSAEAPDETGIDRFLDPDKLNINSDKDKKES